MAKPSQPPSTTPPRRPEPGEREVFLATTRVYVASIVAQLCAVGLFVGVLGAIFTWDDRSAVFDLANGPQGNSKAELGYIFGPAAVMIVLPLIRHRRPRVAFVRRYRTRLAIALLLWLVGLGLLLGHLIGLNGGYTLQAGAYVATTLITVGVLGTAAMWPSGLRRGLLDRRGGVHPQA